MSQGYLDCEFAGMHPCCVFAKRICPASWQAVANTRGMHSKALIAVTYSTLLLAEGVLTQAVACPEMQQADHKYGQGVVRSRMGGEALNLVHLLCVGRVFVTGLAHGGAHHPFPSASSLYLHGQMAQPCCCLQVA
jgi:hypothetical protein